MVIIRNVLSLGNEEYLVSGKSNMCQSVGDWECLVFGNQVSHLEGIKNVLSNTKWT
jgi:hypothetical protein